MTRQGPKVEHHRNPELARLQDSAGLSNQQLADLLGVSISTVNAWRKSADSKGAILCPPQRLNALKIALGKKMADLTDSQRARVMEILRGESR
jgi:transposase